MKSSKGYLLLESIVSLTLIATLTLTLYSLLIFSIKVSASIEDKVELQQQGLEMSKHIKSLIEKSKGIISVEYDNIESIKEDGIEYKSAKSIKCRYKSDLENSNSSVKNKEISYKYNQKKLFINSLKANNQSDIGGYEIGDYVERMYVSNKDDKFIDVKLRLCKNNEVYETKFKVYIRNFERGI
ncbi:hypothetical protein HF520_09400 [Romboutsia sp. CE17]|uniref:hypothetical protein n=1 Tax=Romboutsia sp. CE17 TaxID=2724150 RepID=UPI001442A4C0|nr:hypothetical protein [Romboutsia sp. CE17]QJA09153.1 hypothetical protein HF520_09400 [Romboutsia sp. CE17]